MADDGSVTEAVQRAAEAMGGIDVVVNNAGIGAQGTVETNPLDEWRKVFEVNVFGMVRVMRGCAPASATVVARLGRQHMLDRGYRRPARSGPVQRQQGGGVVADAGDGSRPSARGDPCQLRQPRHRRHPVGCPATGASRRPGRRTRRVGGSSAVGASGDRAKRSPAQCCTSPGPIAGATTGISLAVDGGMAGLRLRPR